VNFIWLEDFLALADTGNFSRAAERRHSSQPAFSRRIRALEEWVGVELIDRSHQPAKLTEAGEWFRGVAQQLLAKISRLPDDARRISEASSKTLRLASTHALSFTFLPHWLRSLEAGTTLGPLQLMSDVLQRCEGLMQQGKVQFVISHAHPEAQSTLDSDSYLSIPIGEDRLIPVSMPGAEGQPRFPLQAEAPVLSYSEESGLQRIIHTIFGHRLEAFALQTVFTAHLASVLRTMVLHGRGLAWLPRSLVEDDLRTGLLVAAAGEEWCIPVAIKLYREHGFAGKAAEEFWRSVAESLTTAVI